MKKKEDTIRLKEPGILVKPLGRFGGLDGIHITLIIVIALLFMLLLVISYAKPVVITNSTDLANCTYGIFNGSCAKPLHNITQISAMTERILASYASVNSSLSLLPFISNVSTMNITYLPTISEWYVTVRAQELSSNFIFIMSFLIKDSNISTITPLLQTVLPSKISDNQVVSQGVVKLSGKVNCITQNSMNVYWFLDPYAAGSVRSLLNATALQSRFGNRTNVTIKILFGSSTENIGKTYGFDNATLLGKYVLCASKQQGFGSFVSNLNAIYSGTYVPNGVLSSIANASNLDYSELNSCIASSTQTINAQALLASYYNVTQTPAVITDCEYLSLPQTAIQAVCYSNKALC